MWKHVVCVVVLAAACGDGAHPDDADRPTVVRIGVHVEQAKGAERAREPFDHGVVAAFAHVRDRQQH